MAAVPGVVMGVVLGLVLGVVAVLLPGAAAAAAAGPEPLRAVPRVAYTWPLVPVPAVVRPFEAPTHRFGPGHRGVDLAPAAPGTAGASGVAVLAAAAGVVVFAGSVAGRGVVSVAHPDGLRTTYEPVTAGVGAGTRVERGAVLGRLQAGHPGCRAPCLHWGARRDRTTYLDPLLLLRPARVRLLPVPDPWPDGPVPALPPGTAGTGHARGWAWSWAALSRSTVTWV